MITDGSVLIEQHMITSRVAPTSTESSMGSVVGRTTKQPNIQSLLVEAMNGTDNEALESSNVIGVLPSNGGQQQRKKPPSNEVTATTPNGFATNWAKLAFNKPVSNRPQAGNGHTPGSNPGTFDG